MVELSWWLLLSESRSRSSAQSERPHDLKLDLALSLSCFKEIPIFLIHCPKDVGTSLVLYVGRILPGANYSGKNQMIILPLSESMFMLKDKYVKCIEILK